jgi:hypothetical protein
MAARGSVECGNRGHRARRCAALCGTSSIARSRAFCLDRQMRLPFCWGAPQPSCLRPPNTHVALMEPAAIAPAWTIRDEIAASTSAAEPQAGNLCSVPIIRLDLPRSLVVYLARSMERRGLAVALSRHRMCFLNRQAAQRGHTSVEGGRSSCQYRLEEQPSSIDQPRDLGRLPTRPQPAAVSVKTFSSNRSN